MRSKGGATMFAFNYNCGGFAFANFEWYLPYRYKDLHNWWDYSEEVTLEYYINSMLSDFSNLRLINSEKELQEDEVLILFRIGDDDFHYVRKERNGKYYHKMGARPLIHEMPEHEVYSESWIDGRYDSRIVMFAYKQEDLDEWDIDHFEQGYIY